VAVPVPFSWDSAPLDGEELETLPAGSLGRSDMGAVAIGWVAGGCFASYFTGVDAAADTVFHPLKRSLARGDCLVKVTDVERPTCGASRAQLLPLLGWQVPFVDRGDNDVVRINHFG